MKFNNVLDYNRNLLTNLSGLYLQGGKREEGGVVKCA